MFLSSLSFKHTPPGAKKLANDRLIDSVNAMMVFSDAFSKLLWDLTAEKVAGQ